jgi:hypothetical protein
MKKKRMQMGGMARAVPYGRGKGPNSGMMTRPGRMPRPERPMIPPNRGDVMTRPGVLDRPYSELRPGVLPLSMLDKARARPAMRGGGLARKGVGMALARGGLVKANGCAQRGKTKGKMV